jgi:hypothetical protein
MAFSKWQSVAVTRHARMLEVGPAHRFRDWPCPELPEVAAGVYTVWENKQLLFVGQAGARWSETDRQRYRSAGARRGLYPRLRSHRSGRRGGDPLCLNLCDRLVLPRLSQSDIEAVAAGSASLDATVRAYLIDRCSYRFELLDEGLLIRRVMAMVRQGRLDAGKPILDPGADP